MISERFYRRTWQVLLAVIILYLFVPSAQADEYDDVGEIAVRCYAIALVGSDTPADSAWWSGFAYNWIDDDPLVDAAIEEVVLELVNSGNIGKPIIRDAKAACDQLKAELLEWEADAAKTEVE